MRKNNFYIFICLSLFVYCSCGIDANNVSTNIMEGTYQSTTQKVDNLTNIDKNKICDFAYRLRLVIKNRDAALFKTWLDEKGIFSVTHFVDGRDRDSIIHVTKDILRDDLVLANVENKAGISLVSMFPAINEGSSKDISIQISHYLNDFNFPVNWSATNTDIITEKLSDIIKSCRQIIMINNKFEPQVFILNNNIYALVYSFTTDSNAEIHGDWVIFEEVSDKYFVRAVMQFQ